MKSAGFSCRPPAALVRQRKLAWSEYKRVRGEFGRSSHVAAAALQEFQAVNNQYRDHAVRMQIQHEEGLLSVLKESPKKFHHYIRSKKVGRPSVGPLLLSTGQVTGDPSRMACEFASSFASVYQAGTLESPLPHQVSAGRIDNVIISPVRVREVLESLDGSSSMGPDDLHPKFLKMCSSSLARPLSVIFESSLREMSLPVIWKDSLVVPIYKKGKRQDPLNYRPISLTSVCCKSMERIISGSLTEYFESSLILSEDQFGFRAGRSTEDQLLLTYDYLTGCIEDGYVAFLVLFDFSKAFDVVDHVLLLTKLKLVGVGGRLLGWISDFLVGRWMRVVVGGCCSPRRPVLSGVPQGSVLGPLLFLIYINHISSRVSSFCKLFADDLKLVFRVRVSPGEDFIQDVIQCQGDIDLIFNTAESWGLNMNADKCSMIFFGRDSQCSAIAKHVSFKMGDQLIRQSVSSVDLGVTIDSSLKFHDHIANTVRKAGGLATNLLRSTLNREANFMTTLFVSHIRPIIDYCSCLWNTGYSGDLHMLESIQRRWTRNVSGLQNVSYAERLDRLNLYSIKGRLLRSDLIKYWKIFHGKCIIHPDQLFAPARDVRTRGHSFKIGVVRLTLECRRRSFGARCVDIWNSLPAAVVNCQSLSEFKSCLHVELADELFNFV